MNILRIVYDWPPPWDGLAPAPYEMTQEQVNLGHHVDIFCGRWPMAGPVEKLPNTTVTPFIREPYPGFLNLTTSVLMFIYYLYWRLNNKPDVIHSHGHFGIWLYAYRNFLKRKFPDSEELKIPLVVHFHNTIKGRWEKLKKQGKDIKPLSEYLSWPLALKSDMWGVAAADACIFVSADIREDAIKYYNADPDSCFVIESGVNISTFKSVGMEEKAKIRNDLGIAPSDTVILNVGAMVERKNIHLLIETLRYLPTNYKLVLVGPRSGDPYEEKLMDLITKYDLQYRIFRVGYTPHPEVPIAHQASDLFVLPSEWEGLPKVVLQSLACGVPALASGFKAQNAIRGLYYIDKLTPKDLANQIKEIVNKHVHVDVANVMNNYSWKVMARKVDQVYEKVLNSKK